MQMAILIAAMTLGTLVFFRLRLARTSSRAGRKLDRRTGFGESNPFHAVSIQVAEQACSAAQAMSLQRFLSDEAPGLPLRDCGAADCSCKYIHHGDRRGGARDRRLGASEHSDESEFWSLRERRIAMGRRQRDLQTARAS